jgi:DnaJ-class molecular chaperone
MRDYYEVLELGRGATSEEIRSSYRRLAMKWHPDRNGGSAVAEERFKQVAEAYSVLSDEATRRDYDARLAGGWSGRTGQEQTRGYSGFRPEEAASMFMREMYALAVELTMQNVGWRDIAAELARRGCPEEIAADIARRIEIGRKEMVRGNARPYFVRSAASGFVGLFLFTVFGGLGFGLLGLLGLGMCLTSAYNLVRAIYFMATGNAPRRSLT